MARIRSRFGLLEPDQEGGHECHESECQQRHPRYETPPEPLSQPAKLTTEGCPPFRFEDRDFIVVVAAICGKRPERRLALAAGVFELCSDVLAAELLLAALVVARDLLHKEFRDESTVPTLRTVVHPRCSYRLARMSVALCPWSLGEGSCGFLTAMHSLSRSY